MNIYYLNLVTYFGLYNKLTIPKGLENLKSLIKDQNNKIILSVLWEVWPHEKILSVLEILEVTLKQDNVVLILDVYSYRDPDHWKTVNVVLYDSLLCRVHQSEKPKFTNNIDNEKFLFMAGKPHKKQRVFPIYELYQRHRLNDGEWSLHYKPYLERVVRRHLPNMSDHDYLKFITHATKKIDDVSPRYTRDPIIGEVTTDFYPIAFVPTANIYAKTSVSLVTETFFDPNIFWVITEKTWKAINNFHPFVLIGYKEAYEHLHSLGIDTFQYAVKHPYTNLVGTEEEVIRLCIDNLLHLLECKHQYKDQLTASVIHNKKIFEKLANMYSNNLHPYIEKIIWVDAVHKVRNQIALEVYEKLWNVGSP